jgi:hypothetical protein
MSDSEYAPLVLKEYKLTMTMFFNYKHGNKGYKIDETALEHKIYAHTSNTTRDISGESTPSGSVPISVVHGIKIPNFTVTGYFPWRYPTEFWDVFMPSLASFRVKNTVKNIFLTGTLLYVVSNGGGAFYEMPVGSIWYVKKYTWQRNMGHPDRGEFNLVLLRWYKGLTV